MNQGSFLNLSSMVLHQFGRINHYLAYTRQRFDKFKLGPLQDNYGNIHERCKSRGFGYESLQNGMHRNGEMEPNLVYTEMPKYQEAFSANLPFTGLEGSSKVFS